MSAIEVLAPGLLTTVQDLGREGFGPMGVSPSGAADPIALRIGNRLVGNAEGAAGMEMTLLGGTFQFHGACVAALTGSDFSATLDGAAVPPWISFQVRPRQTLRRKSREERSEEHTSELQSRLHLVCRLLLEKKNESVVTRLHR